MKQAGCRLTVLENSQPGTIGSGASPIKTSSCLAGSQFVAGVAFFDLSDDVDTSESGVPSLEDAPPPVSPRPSHTVTSKIVVKTHQPAKEAEVHTSTSNRTNRHLCRSYNEQGILWSCV